jgi:hypothetical protein
MINLIIIQKNYVQVQNAVELIERVGLPFVDVFKIDIDSFDCDVMPAVLRAYRPALVIAEFNVYFPPPIKMKLVPSASGYDSNKRGTTYECSIQFLNDDVMRPLGYVLLQLDWQNVIYARREIAAALGMHGGVDVQVCLCVSCLMCAVPRVRHGVMYSHVRQDSLVSTCRCVSVCLDVVSVCV